VSADGEIIMMEEVNDDGKYPWWKRKIIYKQEFREDGVLMDESFNMFSRCH